MQTYDADISAVKSEDTLYEINYGMNWNQGIVTIEEGYNTWLFYVKNLDIFYSYMLFSCNHIKWYYVK